MFTLLSIKYVVTLRSKKIKKIYWPYPIYTTGFENSSYASFRRRRNFPHILRFPPTNFQLARTRGGILILSPANKTSAGSYRRLIRICIWLLQKKRLYQLTLAWQVWHRTFGRMRLPRCSSLFLSRLLLRSTLCASLCGTGLSVTADGSVAALMMTATTSASV